MPAAAPTPRRGLPTLIGLTLLAGSLFAMSTALPGSTAAHAAEPGDDGTVASWPLRFSHHDFDVACFDTQRCKVHYHGFDFGNPEPTPSAASLSPEAYDDALSASYGPVPRNTPAAQIDWVSKDGSALQAQVDIAAIFRDGLVRHHVAREDIAEGASIGGTAVLLEVDDRSINVYTRTLIPLKAPLDPSNRDSDIRDELIKVYSRTY